MNITKYVGMATVNEQKLHRVICGKCARYGKPCTGIIRNRFRSTGFGLYNNKRQCSQFIPRATW